MKTNWTLKRLSLGLVCAGLVALQGCGGGGGGEEAAAPVAPTAAVFSGTVAAGLPLVGSVTVKDAAGATRTATIGADGNYSVDVTGMTAPFVFRAEGNVGAQRYVIHSAASAADLNGTINITPLTDLVVANIAGQLAANYFDGGSFGALSKAELDAETASLKAKLLPVLTAMGVDASIDLLRTAFTPLSSALDKALDVLRVSVDPVTRVATITNLVNQQQIQDDLATRAAAETAATPMVASGMDGAKDDLPLIRKAVTDFIARFATGLPSAGSLLAVMHDDPDLPFRDQDLNATQFSNQMAAQSRLVGASFTDVVVKRINYATGDAWPRAVVSFDVRNSAGALIDHVDNMQVAKDADGVWRLRGNNQLLDIYSQALMIKDAVRGCVRTGLEFGFEDLNTANSSGIAYFKVTGPGLPQGGLRYARPQVGGSWKLADVNGQTDRNYTLATDCPNAASAGLSDTQIAAIPANAVYTLTAYDANDAVFQRSGSDIVYRHTIPGRPLTLAESASAAFPAVTTSANLASWSGGELTLSASGIPSASAWFYLGLSDAQGNVSSSDGDLAVSASGTVSKSVTLDSMPGAVRRELRLEGYDSQWRTLMTVINHFTAP